MIVLLFIDLNFLHLNGDCFRSSIFSFRLSLNFMADNFLSLEMKVSMFKRDFEKLSS